ncbi:uncharacterized protein FTJAE_5759 [Fusarium tjaetaba]|uniref:Uncharacterized protein n=1 Tax=Fusarium tjaetaba TaxID=1567544 RepID=A0A8H5RPI2_9HYPO|nr:uncharacterized protein FTJAE_5759 [Fusarium tjaetaba]KAF5637344.1 hypothetical protein FTJAE_5759 [Fusarium tjaetaba]
MAQHLKIFALKEKIEAMAEENKLLTCVFQPYILLQLGTGEVSKVIIAGLTPDCVSALHLILTVQGRNAKRVSEVIDNLLRQLKLEFLLWFNFAALKRANQDTNRETRPEPENRGVALVENLALRSVTTLELP